MLMAETHTFHSPLSLSACEQRLVVLAARKHYDVTAGRFMVNVRIDAIDIQAGAPGRSFRLHSACNSSSFRLPVTVYLKLTGGFQPAESGTLVNFSIRTHRPFNRADWFQDIFWSALVLLALAGGVIGVLLTPPLQSMLIEASFVLAGGVYLWVLNRVRGLAMRSIPELIRQTLGEVGGASLSLPVAPLPPDR
jgi:hypothetical protein